MIAPKNPLARQSVRVMMAALFVLSLAMPAFSDGGGADPDADYDRMDGTGASGKTVNVIEWEGNLEIHVAPPGSLRGLALKLDKTNKDKPVMVIGYRFDNYPGKQLIRRAILGITLNDGFRVYRDKSVAEYDKVIITNNTLAGADLASYRLDPAPKQLYPDGHPALAQQQPASDSGATSDRQPASSSADARQKARAARRRLQDDGTIQPFFGGQAGGTTAPVADEE